MNKIIKIFFVIFTLLIIMNCNRDDCFTPPATIVFEFVNSSGVNLIQNGTISNSDIFIRQNEGNGNSIGVTTKLREDNKIILEGIGWNEGIKNYDVYLDINPIKKFNFKVNSSKITGKCTGYKINELQILNINSTKENGYYKIIVE